ncbi:MAG TPA: hypothetical protein DCM05_17450 [Elusimicrobia bacterium]|nr:hypothetical protein [Elusimicrobiota bacterium]
MKKTLLALLTLTLAAPAFAEKYSVTDQGGFGTTGRFIELPSRFGWQSYEVQYDFKLDPSTRRLGDSKLVLTINKNDGSRWRYRCRTTTDDKTMWANIHPIYGNGTQVLTECRIDPRHFSRAVGLRADEVGEPTLVFAVRIVDGKAEAGVHKGFYFLGGRELEGSSISAYATPEADPSNLGVVFNTAAVPGSVTGPLTRYVP